jgi:phosphoglycolate phosphatase-like HAD superfamily hydrolase
MRAAIFDMDGTLVDSEALAFRAAEEGLRDYWARRGLPPRIPSRAEIRALVGLPSLEYFGRLLPEERRGDAAEVRLLVAHREVDRLRAGEGRLYPGIVESLAALRAGGWRLGLVSNCGRIYFSANLEHLGLGRLFDCAFCLDDRPSKAESVGAALERLGAARGVMVGDRAADLEAGRANGLRTVGCAWGFAAAGELDGADARAETPSTLAGIIEALVHRP